MFRVLSKRYLRSKGEVTTPTIETTPITGTFDTIPTTPTTSIETGTNSLQSTDTVSLNVYTHITDILVHVHVHAHVHAHVQYKMITESTVYVTIVSRG